MTLGYFKNLSNMISKNVAYRGLVKKPAFNEFDTLDGLEKDAKDCVDLAKVILKDIKLMKAHTYSFMPPGVSVRLHEVLPLYPSCASSSLLDAAACYSDAISYIDNLQQKIPNNAQLINAESKMESLVSKAGKVIKLNRKRHQTFVKLHYTWQCVYGHEPQSTLDITIDADPPPSQLGEDTQRRLKEYRKMDSEINKQGIASLSETMSLSIGSDSPRSLGIRPPVALQSQTYSPGRSVDGKTSYLDKLQYYRTLYKQQGDEVRSSWNNLIDRKQLVEESIREIFAHTLEFYHKLGIFLAPLQQVEFVKERPTLTTGGTLTKTFGNSFMSMEIGCDRQHSFMSSVSGQVHDAIDDDELFLGGTVCSKEGATTNRTVLTSESRRMMYNKAKDAFM